MRTEIDFRSVSDRFKLDRSQCEQPLTLIIFVVIVSGHQMFFGRFSGTKNLSNVFVRLDRLGNHVA